MTSPAKVANQKKKKFEEKWKYEGGEWKGKWQTKKEMDIPEDLPPYLDNMRMWMFEMSEWAQRVNEQLGELIEDVESLKKNPRA